LLLKAAKASEDGEYKNAEGKKGRPPGKDVASEKDKPFNNTKK
jgi:hypothetical protein